MIAWLKVAAGKVAWVVCGILAGMALLGTALLILWDKMRLPAKDPEPDGTLPFACAAEGQTASRVYAVIDSEPYA